MPPSARDRTLETVHWPTNGLHMMNETVIYAGLGRPDVADTGSGLRGRGRECAALDRLVADARAGRSAVVVLRGEAGAGKSALLEFVAARALDCRIARAAGVESEMELAFAGLDQLGAPMLAHLDRMPGPQRDALGTAFGLSAGGAPDRFLVGLAVLSLLADVAEEQPLVCVIDDAQWLDQASAQTLAFVARRLLAEPVAMVFAARADGQDQPLRGLPELAGGFALPGMMPLSSLIEQGFLRRLEPLLAQTRQFLLTAAAEPVGDVT